MQHCAALRLKPVISEKAKGNQSLSHGKGVKGRQISDNLNTVDTKIELAKMAGVSHDTIAKVEKIEREAASDIKDKVKSGKAQYIAEAVMDAEVRVGELLKPIPKATPNNNPFHENQNPKSGL